MTESQTLKTRRGREAALVNDVKEKFTSIIAANLEFSNFHVATANLIYKVIVGRDLKFYPAKTVPPRGLGFAFQTDLCLFEHIDNGKDIPRVVFEFKIGLSTHDIILYSTKAR